MNNLKMLMLTGLIGTVGASAEEPTDSIGDLFDTELQEVVVKTASRRKLSTATNSELLTSAELRRAACCNLGESFTTNPSVDVSYSDAATGARQIRLLGLNGTYVQMMHENIPFLRGAAAPYGLSYVPGPWMQSIQISKGAASVKNGYESVSGQINVESRKPQGPQGLQVNGYFDSEEKGELNLSGNLHLPRDWSGSLLLHGEHSFKSHDGNDDGFIDMPAISQLSAFNRWACVRDNNIFQAGVKLLTERRRSGQETHHHPVSPDELPLYKIRLDTRRAEAFVKNGYIFDQENDGNIAAMVSATIHDQHALYGMKEYDVIQKEFYAQLMFERKWGEHHALSSGLSFSYDNYRQWLHAIQKEGMVSRLPIEHEGVSGGYAQYTYTLPGYLIAMGGIRYDYSSLYGSLLTPRLHIRWTPAEPWSFNLSAGIGRHTPHPLAEYSYLLASSRSLVIDADLRQEKALNAGLSASWSKTLFDREFSLTAEYYYTRFSHCLTVDLDRDPHGAWLSTANRGSRGHTVQIEATGQIIESMTLTAAWRLNDVKVDFGDGVFRDRPLTSRSKWLFSWSYEPMMGLWQFDATLAVNGPGRMPTPALGSDGSPLWNERYSGFAQLNLQITRNFRHWAVYVGGENITGYRQKDPIISASNPWSADFDATMIHAPLHGAMVYVGFRFGI